MSSCAVHNPCHSRWQNACCEAQSLRQQLGCQWRVAVAGDQKMGPAVLFTLVVFAGPHSRFSTTCRLLSAAPAATSAGILPLLHGPPVASLLLLPLPLPSLLHGRPAQLVRSSMQAAAPPSSAAAPFGTLLSADGTRHCSVCSLVWHIESLTCGAAAACWRRFLAGRTFCPPLHITQISALRPF